LHLSLLGRAHAIEAAVRQGAEKTRASRGRETVRVVAELDIEIEHTLGHGPIDRAIAAEFGARVEGDEQHVASRRVRRRFQPEQFILPKPKATPAAQFASDQTNWDLALAGESFELEIRDDDLAEGVEHLSLAAELLHYRMVDAVDQVVAEGDFDQIPKA
jgi:hypothetical protein